MSRTIDPDKPLSDDDRNWLNERGQYNDILVHDSNHGVEVEPDYSAHIDGNSTYLQEGEINPLAGDDEDEDHDGMDVPYSAWSKADLVDEAKRRELSHSGTKDDLIARLEEDDESDDDGEDEE